LRGGTEEERDIANEGREAGDASEDRVQGLTEPKAKMAGRSLVRRTRESDIMEVSRGRRQGSPIGAVKCVC